MNGTGTNRPTVKHEPHASEVVQSDDGRYRLGINDDGPGFESRPFAASVMARERPPPDLKMRTPATGMAGGNRKITGESSKTIRRTRSAFKLRSSTRWRYEPQAQGRTERA